MCYSTRWHTSLVPPDISLLYDQPAQASSTHPISAASSSALLMAQELDIEQKLHPVILCPLDDSTLYCASDPSHPEVQTKAQSEKGDAAASDSAPLNHSQDDYPDGLHAWLMVFGVRNSD
jgi:hypothetical protein